MGILSTIRKIERFSSRNSETPVSNIDITEIEDDSFGGVPVEDLDELARSIYRGVEVVINSGILDFVFTSRSGKKRRHAEYIVGDSNQLEMISNYYYENEYHNPADDFLKEANERFSFESED